MAINSGKPASSVKHRTYREFGIFRFACYQHRQRLRNINAAERLEGPLALLRARDEILRNNRPWNRSESSAIKRFTEHFRRQIQGLQFQRVYAPRLSAMHD